MPKLKTCCFIGSGNLASQLAPALQSVEINVFQVLSRQLDRAAPLAHATAAQPITDFSELDTSADFYVLAVSDSSIETVAAQLPSAIREKKLVVHCSGATSITALASCNRRGVFYPLQSFSMERILDFQEIPIGVSANTNPDQEALLNLAGRISGTTHIWGDEQRQALHLAAVFVNNFTNHILGIASALTAEKGVDFANLLPLLDETILKAKVMPPFSVQTGPAQRNDQVTISRHLDQLAAHPEWAAVYDQLSKSITSVK